MPISGEDGGGDALVLDGRLDLQAAAPLLASLRARRDSPVSLDAGNVSHLGGLCLQILLASAAEWRQRGHRLSLSPLSAAFTDALQAFGISPDDLQAPGTPLFATEEA